MNDPMRQILENKLARRKELAALPVGEKLRLLERNDRGHPRDYREPSGEAVQFNSARAKDHLKSGEQSVTGPPRPLSIGWKRLGSSPGISSP